MILAYIFYKEDNKEDTDVECLAVDSGKVEDNSRKIKNGGIVESSSSSDSSGTDIFVVYFVTPCHILVYFFRKSLIYHQIY